MATGMDMLVNTVLKACGYSKEQLDEGLAIGKAKIQQFEARFVALETNIGEVLAILKKEGNDNVSDVHGGGDSSGQ